VLDVAEKAVTFQRPTGVGIAAELLDESSVFPLLQNTGPVRLVRSAEVKRPLRAVAVPAREKLGSAIMRQIPLSCRSPSPETHPDALLP